MKRLTWIEMRRAARGQLLAYRKNAMVMRRLNMDAHAPSRASKRRTAPPVLTEGEIAKILLWKQVIDGVRAALRNENPLLERFMVRYFAMRVPKNRRQTESARHIQIAEELHVSESTLYRWKEQVLQLVIAAAVQAGALQPFRFPAGAAGQTPDACGLPAGQALHPCGLPAGQALHPCGLSEAERQDGD